MRLPGNLRKSRTVATNMVAGNRVTLLHDGRACFPAMLAAIAAARREILVEMYWFGSDGTGLRFAEALSERAREGLEVWVSYDSVGSWDSDRSVFDLMRAAGVRVRAYNPIGPWLSRFRVTRLNHRNHRKLLVIDGEVGFTGGVNFADQWAAVEDGGGGWRDDMVQIDGPAVSRMRAIALSVWESTIDELEIEAPARLAGGSPVSVLANDLRKKRRAIENAYVDRIRRARTSILIANSYFIPRLAVRRALARAVRRGVEVRVLLPVISDVPAVAYATRRLYTWLLRRGVQIHEWPVSILHAKTAVVDSSWCTVGTHNLDYRSWRYNLEINVAVDDPAVATALERRMRSDLAASIPVSLESWRYRPLLNRALEFFFYRFRRLL